MVLTRCFEGGKSFPCDVTLLRNYLVVSNIEASRIIKVGLNSIMDVKLRNNELVITYREGEISIATTSELKHQLRKLLRIYEVKMKYRDMLMLINSLTRYLVSIISGCFNILQSLRRGAFPDWGKIGEYLDNIYPLLVRARTLNVDLVIPANELKDSIRDRSVSRIRAAIKRLLRLSLYELSKTVRTRYETVDFTPLFSSIVIIATYLFADEMGFAFEKSRSLTELRETLTHFYTEVAENGEQLVNRLFSKLEEELTKGKSLERAVDILVKEVFTVLKEEYLGRGTTAGNLGTA